VTAPLAIAAIGFGLISASIANQSAVWSRIFKIAASTSMVAIIVTGDPSMNSYAILITAGLIASWFGDLALSFDGEKAFLAGLVSFALAHSLYTAGFFARSPMDLLGIAVSGVTMALTAAAILRWLAPHTPDRLKTPVAAYIAIISVMVVASFGTSGALPDPRIPIAAVLFATSDVLVARQQFVAPALFNRLVGLPVYFAAQVLFAITVVSPWT